MSCKCCKPIPVWRIRKLGIYIFNPWRSTKITRELQLYEAELSPLSSQEGSHCSLFSMQLTRRGRCGVLVNLQPCLGVCAVPWKRTASPWPTLMAAQSENWWSSIKWIRRVLCALLGFHSRPRPGKSNLIIEEWKEIQTYFEIKNLERRKRGAWHSSLDVGIMRVVWVPAGMDRGCVFTWQCWRAEQPGRKRWTVKHIQYRPGLWSTQAHGVHLCVSAHMAKVKLRLGLSAWAALLNNASMRPTVTLGQMWAQCALQQGGPPNTVNTLQIKVPPNWISV